LSGNEKGKVAGSDKEGTQKKTAKEIQFRRSDFGGKRTKIIWGEALTVFSRRAGRHTVDYRTSREKHYAHWKTSSRSGRQTTGGKKIAKKRKPEWGISSSWAGRTFSHIRAKGGLKRRRVEEDFLKAAAKQAV